MNELVEMGAMALWQEESVRARGKRRQVHWSDWDEQDKAIYRRRARAVLLAALGYRGKHDLNGDQLLIALRGVQLV